MRALKIVAVNGSPAVSSKTGALVDTLAHTMVTRWPTSTMHRVNVVELAHEIGGAFLPPGPTPAVAEAVALIESADILVAASPIYRGAYTGLFKHLFDLVGQDALVGTPVLLAATGGSERHTLALDHIFRPLFAFFRANTVPTAVYVTQEDFVGPTELSPAVLQRIDAVLASLEWVARTTVD